MAQADIPLLSKYHNAMRAFRTKVILFALLGAGLWLAAFVLTYGDPKPNALLIDLGKIGATLAMVVVIGGLAKDAFSQRDDWAKGREAEIAFVRAVLADFKRVYDRVENARLLIEANKSAKTYGEEISGLTEGVVILHNVRRAVSTGEDFLKERLDAPIDACIGFIKGLLAEFRENYITISQLQGIDEAVNKAAREEIAKAKDRTQDFQPSMRAWTKIAELDELRVLRDDAQYASYEARFVRHIDDASRELRAVLKALEEGTPHVAG